MKRKDALEAFSQESHEIIAEFNNKFWKNLCDEKERILAVWQEGVKRLKADEQLQQKVCTYIYSFMLRYDILNENYNVYLYAVDENYIFDTEAIKAMINLDFLFTEVIEMKSKLLKNSWKYRGKINHYDITNLVFETVVSCNWKICFLLRFMLREHQEHQDICQVLKADKQIVRWGEYRDRGETIFYSIKNYSSQDTLTALLKQNEQYTYILQNSCHDNEIYKDIECQERNLQFAKFTNCTFENIIFNQSDLTGAYFKDCSFEGCSFSECILDLVIFDTCKFQDTQWESAVFFRTYCQDTILEGITSEQSQNILQKKGNFSESIFLYGAGHRHCGLY